MNLNPARASVPIGPVRNTPALGVSSTAQPPGPAPHFAFEGRRVPKTDVVYAVNSGEPTEGVTIRELDIAIKRAIAAKNNARWQLLAKHRLVMVRRAQENL